MKVKLLRFLFSIIKILDKEIYCDIKEFLGDAETYYTDRKNMKIRNNQYNCIKLDTQFDEIAILRIRYIRKMIMKR